jgi:hypothetical protein
VCRVGLLVPVAGLLAAALIGMPALTTTPGTSSGFHDAPSVRLVKYTTRSGLVVLAPKNTSDPCGWDAPLPFTPHPHPLLTLRKAGDLSAGFRVEPFSEDVVIGIPE